MCCCDRRTLVSSLRKLTSEILFKGVIIWLKILFIDCVIDGFRWKALDFAALKRSSVSFFDVQKHETAVSRWARAKTRVAKVFNLLIKLNFL